MQLTSVELKRYLAREGLPKITVISGHEYVQVIEATDAITAKAQQKGYTGRIILKFDGVSSWQEIQQTISTESLFDARRLIELQIQKKINQKERDLLAELPKMLTTNEALVIRDDINPTTKKAWFWALQPSVLIFAKQPSYSELPGWLEQRINLEHWQPDAILTLVERGYGNLAAICNCIRELEASQNITSEMVANRLPDSSNYTTWEFIEAAISGDIERTKQSLQSLSRGKIEINLVIWSLTNEIRQLIDMISMKLRGIPLNQIVTKFPIWDSKKDTYQQALKRLTPARLQYVIRLLRHTDKVNKSGIGSAWECIQVAALALAGHSIYPQEELFQYA